MLGGGGGGCVSHPLQLTTGLVVNSFIITNSHLGFLFLGKCVLAEAKLQF